MNKEVQEYLQVPSVKEGIKRISVSYQQTHVNHLVLSLLHNNGNVHD